MSSDVEKTLTALRTRITELEEQVQAQRLSLPARLIAPAFAVALFALSTVPWVTLGEDEPESFTLWGLLPLVGLPSFALLSTALALAGTVLWSATLDEEIGRVRVAAGVLAVATVAALVWQSVAAGELFEQSHDEDVAWWPAPWLLVFCALGAVSATAVRRR